MNHTSPINSFDIEGTPLRSLTDERDAVRIAMRGFGRAGEFPTEIVEKLARWQISRAVLPTSGGGEGWGTESSGQQTLCKALLTIGYASLSLGRIFEAHVNALALIYKYGNPDIMRFARSAVVGGGLFGLWVAPSAEPVQAVQHGDRLRITGRKAFCTAAGFAAHAVITARDELGHERMILIDASQTQAGPDLVAEMHGMRATSTKAVKIDCDVPVWNYIGAAGDYLREPDFSTGAWRTSAVTVGGLRSLVDETIHQLRARQRHENPHQAARIGHMLMNVRTAEMWVKSAAARSASECTAVASRTGYVNLARRAVEQACLETIPLVQRSLGLNALMSGNPVEGIMRDIATYLRQPAGDEALTEAAVAFAETATPSALGGRP